MPGGGELFQRGGGVSLNDVDQKLHDGIGDILNSGRRFSIAVKVFTAIGAFVFACVEAWGIGTSDSAPPFLTILAIVAASMVTSGALLLAILDADTFKFMGVARDATKIAATIQSEATAQLQQHELLTEEAIRMLGEIESGIIWREAIEQAASTISTTGVSIDNLLVTIFSALEWSMPIAMGFAMTDHWVVGVYRLEQNEDGREYLRLVAHRRAIDCDIQEARKWAVGEGVAGAAFDRDIEIFEPNMNDPYMAQSYPMGEDLVREYDSDRYISLGAVPIRVNDDERPWGVLVASIDRENYFNLEDHAGFSPNIVLGNLAQWVALAVSVSRIFEEKSHTPVKQYLL